MRTQVYVTERLGDLFVAAFDEAARQSTDSQEGSRLATQAVMDMWRHARTTSLLPPPPTTDDEAGDPGRAAGVTVENDLPAILEK